MPYYLTENFSAGVDTRKHPITAPSGTLRDMTNLHVTPGGEIEKRLAFVPAFDCSGTLENSLMNVGPILYVVGSGADQTYGELTLRFISGPPVVSTNTFVDWDIFDGKLYFTTYDTVLGIKHWYQSAVGGTVAANVPNGKGAYLRTHGSKMYSCGGAEIYFSTVGDPTDWTTTASGAGFINTSIQEGEALDLRGIEKYYGKLAFFAKRGIQIWDMDTDPANNILDQTLHSIGSSGQATPRQYGSGDILFLSQTGVRSLQARDSSNSVSVSDVGSPIDSIMQEEIRTNPTGAFWNTRTMLESRTGRFWISLRDEIWVLSLFPGPKVSAWSKYTPKASNGVEFEVSDLVDAAGYVCVREFEGTDTIYVLGGSAQETYDLSPCSFQTPYLGFDKPASWKQYTGFDAAVDETWAISVSYDPDNVVWEPVATITKSTYNDQRIPITGYSPAVSVKMESVSAAKARVANIAIHYNLSKDD